MFLPFSILKNYLPEVDQVFYFKAIIEVLLNYSDIHLEDAKQGLIRLYLSIRNKVESPKSEIDWSNNYATRFKDALDDDFNTPAAIAVLYELANEINKSKDNQNTELLVGLANSLGILTMNPEDFLQGVMMPSIRDDGLDIDGLIKERNLAKEKKNYEGADRIRKLLLENDILLEDTAEGTIWRQK